MRFLVESGTYQIDNLGDIAMLHRTVARLAEGFPGCRIDVVTQRPDRLKRVLPNVHPVLETPWFRLRVVPVPRAWEWTPLVRRIRWREKLLAGRFPRLARAGKRRDFWASRDERASADAFFETVRASDAVVVAGGGYLNDHYHEHAWKVLATLSLAQGLGKPTALFGIGLGPISKPELIWHGGPILRRAKVLGLRESSLGPAEARRLGVPEDRVTVTGDDAIALAAMHTAPPIEQRRHIGVNLRLSVDADVPDDALPRVRDGVADAASRCAAAGITPLIIRTVDSPENDLDAARRIFGNTIDLTDAQDVSLPEHGLVHIARCRVVVTGAYHNAVFALAMGIPVVGLSRSTYYDSKLGGVAEQFGTGMMVLSLADPDLRVKLAAAIEQMWHAAPSLAAPLQDAAARQIAAGEAAYRRFLAPLGDAPAADGTAQ